VRRYLNQTCKLRAKAGRVVCWLAVITFLTGALMATAARANAQCPGLNCRDHNPPTVKISPSSGGPYAPGKSVAVSIQYCDSKPLETTQVVTLAGVTQSGFTLGLPDTCTNPQFPNGDTGAGTVTPPAVGLDTLKASIAGIDSIVGVSWSVLWVADDSLSPRAVTVAFPANVTATDTVTLKNTGASSFTYNITATCHGSLTSCSVASPVTLAAGASKKLAVSFVTAALGTNGTVIVHASNTANVSNDSVTVTVNAQSWMTVTQSVDPNSHDPSACALNCFAVVAAQSTVPYFSGGTGRSVTLHYNGDAATVRPILAADVFTATAAVPTVLELQAKDASGALITFTNGETLLKFNPAGEFFVSRVAGAFVGPGTSMSATGSYKISLIVSAVYGAPYNFTDVQTIATRVLVVNDRESSVARGWTIAGVQRVIWQAADSGVVVTEGDGSAKFFAGPCVTSCTYQTPHGDFTRLSVTGTGGATTYTRTYVDSTKVVFNSLGLETSTTDRFGRQVAFTYDASGRLTRVADPWRTFSGSATYTGLTYGATYGLASITEPGTNGAPASGRVTKDSVRTDSTLASITDPDGLATRYLEDGLNRVIGTVDRRGDSTRVSYDSTTGKLASSTNLHIPVDIGSGSTRDSSLVASFRAWQLAGIPTGVTASSPAPVVLVDTIHAVMVTLPHDTTEWQVSTFGQPMTITDPLKNLTQIGYDTSGVLVNNYSLPHGGNTTLTYSGPLVTTITQAGSPTLHIHYSSYGQADSSYGTGYPSQRWYRGTDGHLDSLRVALPEDSSTTRYYHDTLIRDTSVVDANGHTTKTHYDAVFANVDSILMPNGGYTAMRFDGYGRDTSVLSSGLATRRIRYSVMNADSAIYDGVNATPTIFAYDGLYLTTVTDPKSQTYHDSLNALGGLIKRTDPTGATRSSRYDGTGNLTSWTNRRGQLVTFTADQLGRILSKSGTNVVAGSAGYNDSTHRAVVWNNVERDSIFADTTGWVDSVVTRIASHRYRVFHHHDAAYRGDSTDITTDAGISFVARRVIYDAVTGVVDTVRFAGRNAYQTVASYNHDLTLTGLVYPNGTMDYGWSYTSSHSVYQMQFSGNAGIDNALNQKYGFTQLGQVTNSIPVNVSLNEWANTQYRYDGLGRLSSKREQNITSGNFASTCPADTTSGYVCSAAPTAGDSLTYDAVGDLTGGTVDGVAVSAAYGPANRDTSLRGVRHTFDLDGNVTLNGSHHYFWSADGLLDSVVAGTVTLHYEYNAAGQLVRRSRNGVHERVFLWDGGQLLAELDSGGTNRIGEYAYMGVDRPFAFFAGNTTLSTVSYYGPDVVNGVVGLIRADSSGARDVQQQYSYDEFGLQSTSVDSLSANRLGWKGLIWEGDSTQLYYVRDRWYDPQQGRFMAEDPLGVAAGLNPYAFAGSDWVNGQDPSGDMTVNELLDGCGSDYSCTSSGDDDDDDDAGPPSPPPPPPNPFKMPPVVVGPNPWMTTNWFLAQQDLASFPYYGGTTLPSQPASAPTAFLGGGGTGGAVQSITYASCVADGFVQGLPFAAGAAALGAAHGAIAGNAAAIRNGIRTGVVSGIVLGAATVEVGGEGAVPGFLGGFAAGYVRVEGLAILGGAVIGFAGTLAAEVSGAYLRCVPTAG
jgi:RHS repeat-associated protein